MGSLRIVSSSHRKISLKLIIMKGPGLAYPLQPSIWKLIFKRKKRKSEPMYLPFKDENVQTVLDNDTLNIRMGFVTLLMAVSRGGSLQSMMDLANLRLTTTRRVKV